MSDKKVATGSYDLETIKYFSANVILKVECPHCGYISEVDAGDDFIEYPAPEKNSEFECYECEKEFILNMKIKLTARIEYWTEREGDE